VRIAIDARELEGRPTGVGRYLANLLRCWLKGKGDDRFILYHRRGLPKFDWMDNPRLETQRLPDGIFKQGTWWQQVVLARALRRDRPDVLFAPADSMPLRWRGPTLLTVHDLCYEAHPEWFGRSEGFRRRLLARRAARKARRIVAISGFTRDELIARYRIPSGKIDVVYHGIDESLPGAPFTPEPDLRSRIGIRGPFALIVGSIFERRLPSEIIRAFRLLGDLDLGLVFAGDDRRRARGDLRAEIREQGLESRIAWLEYASEQDLCGLYRSATMLIALSLCEGFSLPPLEAMSFGLPVIVSRRGAQLEVYDGAALTVAQETEEEIASVVRALATEGELRKDLLGRGQRLAAELSLERCAVRTLELIRLTGGAGSA
jgi:glycosyltransferase involved in cell wall biosynthesis